MSLRLLLQSLHARTRFSTTVAPPKLSGHMCSTVRAVSLSAPKPTLHQMQCLGSALITEFSIPRDLVLALATDLPPFAVPVIRQESWV